MKPCHFFHQKPLRNLFLLIIIIAANSGNLNAQNIWRVNGNQGVTGSQVYADVQDAITGAAVGDIIIVEPKTNGTAYSSITLNKRLRIYGSGYYLDRNSQTQYNSTNSKIAGFEFLPLSSGSEVYGLEFAGRNMDIDATHIKIRNCIFTSNVCCNSKLININGDSTCIQGCYFYNSNTETHIVVNSNGNLISNNIFTPTQCYIPPCFSIKVANTGADAVVKNNVMQGDGISIYSSTVTNNIFTKTTVALGGNISTNTIQYNVFVDSAPCQDSLLTNNICGASISLLLQGGITSGNGHPENDFRLLPTYQGVGENGADPGPFGGTNPYELSGMPPIPAIFYLTNDACATPGNPPTLRVHIKAKAH